MDDSYFWATTTTVGSEHSDHPFEDGKGPTSWHIAKKG